MNEVDAAAFLAENGIPDPRREARKLWAAAGDNKERFAALVTRRAAREPMSHLLGYRDFWEHRFEVSGDVLDPRPDTETLVAAALERPFTRVLDLGTGSGCILLSLLAAQEDSSGIGTDLSDAALAVARRNAARLEVDHRVDFTQSDWWEAVEDQFDLIVSNPPYIALGELDALQPELSFEPRMALTDESDGLSCYRIIVSEAPEYLLPGGRLLVEIGPTQGAAVAEMFEAAGLDQVSIRPDLDGRDRVVCGTLPRKTAD